LRLRCSLPDMLLCQVGCDQGLGGHEQRYHCMAMRIA
jgi:hypothetical protein